MFGYNLFKDLSMRDRIYDERLLNHFSRIELETLSDIWDIAIKHDDEFKKKVQSVRAKNFSKWRRESSVHNGRYCNLTLQLIKDLNLNSDIVLFNYLSDLTEDQLVFLKNGCKFKFQNKDLLLKYIIRARCLIDEPDKWSKKENYIKANRKEGLPERYSLHNALNKTFPSRSKRDMSRPLFDEALSLFGGSVPILRISYNENVTHAQIIRFIDFHIKKLISS